jgi:hypothetical protein
MLWVEEDVGMLEMDKWYYLQVKGRIAAHVARGTDKPDAIAKAARTIVSRSHVGQDALAITEVESESVRPFLGPPWNQPPRLERFNNLKSCLGV